jgi:hypothetical protein
LTILWISGIVSSERIEKDGAEETAHYNIRFEERPWQTNVCQVGASPEPLNCQLKGGGQYKSLPNYLYRPSPFQLGEVLYTRDVHGLGQKKEERLSKNMNRICKAPNAAPDTGGITNTVQLVGRKGKQTPRPPVLAESR